jgi:hypothetical protein
MKGGKQVRDVNMQRQLTELKNNLCLRSTAGIEIEETIKHVIFLSFGNPEQRACVCKGIGDSYDAAWLHAAAEMEKKVSKFKIRPEWVKADVVTSIQEYTLSGFIKYISQLKINYFREGIAFDKRFKIAFLEQELNANVFIYEHPKDSAKTVVWQNINFYLKRNTGLNLLLGPDVVERVYTFTTESAFHDGEECYSLGSNWLNNGRRNIDLNRDNLRFIIEKTSDYLCEQVQKSGVFRYGYFPCFDREIEHYNILRHASTAYSMLEAYEVVQSPRLADSIKQALGYLVQKGVKQVKDAQGVERGFVVERTENNSIKLGANAAAVLALAKYTEVFGDDQFMPVIDSLVKGIEYCQRDSGQFVHVLNYPDLSVRDVHRIIYYDGEAAFALMRVYALDKQPKTLQIVEEAFRHFIANKYWRHNDHWLSYCSYELFIHKPEKEYLEFNLKNAQGILDFCLSRETTFATLLELLMATRKFIDYCKNKNLYVDLISEFDEEKLDAAINYRLELQLNGFLFPEVAMYFKVPKHILWGFYIRHHSFRVRIDDIEHNLSGYCNYYQHAWREEFVSDK